MTDKSPSRQTLADYQTDYQQLSDDSLPQSLGFSARLNMLWDLAGIAPLQNEGRVLAVLGLNSNWKESEVRGWLQRDVLPPRLELHNMVKFLVAQLDDTADCEHWEAFISYGSPVVSSPISAKVYRADSIRREIAAMIFARITEQYGIAPATYNADQAFHRCISLMQKFNIYEAQDFQAGHLEPFKRVMFPENS